MPWACGVRELGVRSSSQRGLFALEKGAATAATLDLPLGAASSCPSAAHSLLMFSLSPSRSQIPRNSNI